MERTPKLQRKGSLSLSTRLNQKRHGASPQNRSKILTVFNSAETTLKSDTLQCSPSVISVCSDGGIECTPPHKKMVLSLDESFEFSPKVFDSSFSPTCLLSQTLAIDSPEVGWKWSRHTANESTSNSNSVEKTSTTTPDSAYTADSIFASAGSSSTEIGVSERKRADSCKQRFAYNARIDQRKILEQELRRVENSRAEEKLKQRCAKLQEQLKSAGTQKSINNHSESISSVRTKTQPIASSLMKTSAAVNLKTPEKSKNPELLTDFFNDSDSDCFLLEATQEIESRIETKSQPDTKHYASTTCKIPTSSECITPHNNPAPAITGMSNDKKVTETVANTNSANCKHPEKRSSFYMKFLEDDCPDEWFISLDEVDLQATHNKKNRNSLQRYKSMPAETITSTSGTSKKKDTNDNCIMGARINSNHLMIPPEGSTASISSPSKIKRHSSSHTLSSASTNYRSRRKL